MGLISESGRVLTHQSMSRHSVLLPVVVAALFFFPPFWSLCGSLSLFQPSWCSAHIHQGIPKSHRDWRDWASLLYLYFSHPFVTDSNEWLDRLECEHWCCFSLRSTKQKKVSTCQGTSLASKLADLVTWLDSIQPYSLIILLTVDAWACLSLRRLRCYLTCSAQNPENVAVLCFFRFDFQFSLN